MARLAIAAAEVVSQKGSTQMIRSARIEDVPAIHALITSFAEQGLMLFTCQQAFPNQVSGLLNRWDLNLVA